MEIRKKITLTLQDYTAFNFFALRKRLIWIPVMFPVIFPVFVLISALASGDPAWLEVLLGTFAVSVLMAALLAVMDRLMIKSSAKKQYFSSKDMQAESELTIDDAGLREISDFGSTIVLWENVLRAEEAPTAYYVFFSRMQAIVILKRLLSPEEDKALRQLFSTHLPDKKIRLKKQG